MTQPLPIVQKIESSFVRANALPEFRVGDTVKVWVKIREGEKERLQAFEGVCIRRRQGGARATFTVRKVSYGVGVERVFAEHSPNVDRLEVVSRGKVRQATLYYLRNLSGKAARIKERAWDRAKETSEKKGGRKKRGKHRKAAAKAKADK
ncbi:MAG: 50S ribosomal protein L19 [Deltaproteobacteria bacterium]|nr:50S ribosomal protein L19 [Deltaproteobacteria bacterium]